MLSSRQLAEFERDGFVVVRGLLDPGRCRDLLCAMDRLLCAKWPRLKPSTAADVEAELHDKIREVAAFDRKGLGRYYDAVRKIADVWTMTTDPRMTSVVGELLRSDAVGLAFRGCGIRLDLPNEDRWRSHWHQEYHSQMSSPNAVTAWCSLVPVTQSMGPVELLGGSHREGLLPVTCGDPMNASRDYTATFRMPQIEALTAKYPSASVETGMGDVVFLHFFTVHQSGFNRDERRSRVTAQLRFFDMMHETSIAHDWVGGWQDGGDFRALHPDRVVT